MTREKEAEIISERIGATSLMYGKLHNDTLKGLLKHYQRGFVTGVKWADDNPKSPWISVDDDLPCNHSEHKYHEKASSTKDVLIRRADNSYSIDCMMVRDEKWDWVLGSLIGIYPTHWMPIPKIPKE